jgi:hypothetical protein
VNQNQRIDPVNGNIARQLLGLSEEQVLRRVSAAQACSSYHKSERADELRAATQAVLAASCSLLIDVAASQRYWQNAADRYVRLEHPFAEVLSVCAGGRHGAGPSGVPQSPLALQCRLFRLAWLSIIQPANISSYRNELQELRELTEQFHALVAGQLAIPVWYAHELTRTLSNDEQGHETSRSVGEVLRRLLSRAGDSVRHAQSDRYHWQRVMPGFMPVEPEWLAIGRIGYQAIMNGNADLAAMTERLTKLEMLPLRLAAGMPPARPSSIRGNSPDAPGGIGGKGRSVVENEAHNEL